MKLMKYACLFLFPILIACPPEEEPLPSCLETRIDSFKLDQATCENANIKIYSFQNQNVYVFTQGICISDSGSSVVLNDCSNLCTLGGIAGLTDCEGVDFYENSTLLETLWEAQ